MVMLAPTPTPTRTSPAPGPRTVPAPGPTVRPAYSSREAAGLLASLAAGLILLQHLLGALGGVVWWTFDSGPLGQHPRDVLTETSPFGAVRVFGDYPGVDAGTAARDTVDTLVDAGGLQQDILMVTLPTGSGWVDPDQVEAVEEWADGDVATVGTRYARTPSAVAYMMRPDVAVESATALIKEVVDRVEAMPQAQRPEILVHGQSLGVAAGTEAVSELGVEDSIAAQLGQGRPGATGEPDARTCTIDAVNADDPVAKLNWGLLADPVKAVGVLADLPGAESKSPGSGHSYSPVLPPQGCVAGV